MACSLLLFWSWAVVGFLGSWLLLYAFTPIGPAIVLVVWSADRLLARLAGRRLPEAYGALGGLGAFWLFLASSIDGDPGPYWTLGASLVGLSLVLYLVGPRRRCAKPMLDA